MKTKRNYFLLILFSLFTLFCMVMIFMFSFQSGEASAGVSVSFYDIFLQLTGFDFISHDAFRKIAHFCEFAALGFGFCGTVYFWCNESKFLLPFVLSVLYALSDEIHQMFVPERAGRIFDIFVDACGSSFGIFVLYLFLIVFKKIKS